MCAWLEAQQPKVDTARLRAPRRRNTARSGATIAGRLAARRSWRLRAGWQLGVWLPAAPKPPTHESAQTAARDAAATQTKSKVGGSRDVGWKTRGG